MGDADSCRSWIVSAINNLAASLRDQFSVDSIDGGEILVEIKMFGFNVEDDRVFGMVVDEGSVALVAFGDKVFAGRVPPCVRAKDRDLCADVVRWLEPTTSQHVGRHRRSGRFAVHATDHNALLGIHDSRQSIGSSDHRDAQLSRFVIGDIARLDSGRIDDQLGPLNFNRLVRNAKPKSLFLQTSHLDSGNLVGSTDAVAQGEKKSRDATHP